VGAMSTVCSRQPALNGGTGLMLCCCWAQPVHAKRYNYEAIGVTLRSCRHNLQTVTYLERVVGCCKERSSQHQLRGAAIHGHLVADEVVVEPMARSPYSPSSSKDRCRDCRVCTGFGRQVPSDQRTEPAAVIGSSLRDDVAKVASSP